MNVFEKINKLKIIPVATIDNVNDALPLGKTLIKAGLPIIEVTFRTEAATESIKSLNKLSPNLFIGVGTVLKIDQVQKALDAGAQFIVTPGFNPNVVDYCIEQKIPIIPGVNTPTFVEWALERNIKVVKFFPANLSGGVSMLKSLAGPYPEMKFVPTGGINNKSLIEYLKLDNVLACGGSWIVKKELISSGKFEDIYNLIQETISLIKLEFE